MTLKDVTETLPPNAGPRGQMHRGTVGVILECAQNSVSLLTVLCTSRKRDTQSLQKLLAGPLFQNCIEIIHIRFLNNQQTRLAKPHLRHYLRSRSI